MGGQYSKQFGYEFGAVDSALGGKSLWTLHDGVNKQNGMKVSIFAYDKQAAPNLFPYAENGLKRLKTLRHPNFLKYVDGVEVETHFYVVTEHVRPLCTVLKELTPEGLAWGIHQLATGLKFLNEDCGLMHGNFVLSSMFVTDSGDWRVGCLDMVSEKGAEQQLLASAPYPPPQYLPPELVKKSWEDISGAPTWCLDSWMLGTLVWELFNGPLTSVDQLRDLSHIPQELIQQYQKMFSASPRSRLAPKKLLESAYFDNPCVSTCLFLENIAIKDSFEKENFFKKLPSLLEKFPCSMRKYKILPHLITAVDFGAGNARVLASLLKIGQELSEGEYSALLTPAIVKWFSSNDRAMRATLLQSLESFVDHLPGKIISSQIYPSLVSGFSDAVPALREATVKAMLQIVPKLDTKQVDGDLLQHFHRLQSDPEPGIRTNTTICLGRIAKYLSPGIRKKVLIPAFVRTLRDSFVHARLAGVMALTATQEYYDPAELANKVMPAFCVLSVDPDSQVRQKAINGLKVMLKRVEEYAAAAATATQASTSASAQTQQAPSSSDEGYMSWALSFGKKLYNTGDEPKAQTQALQKTSSLSAPPPSEAPRQFSAASEKYTPAATASATATARATVAAAAAAPLPTPASDGWDEDDFDFDEPAAPSQPQAAAAQPVRAPAQQVGFEDDTAGGGGWDDFDDNFDDDGPSAPAVPAATKYPTKAAAIEDDDDWGTFEQSVTSSTSKKMSKMELNMKRKAEKSKRGGKAE